MRKSLFLSRQNFLRAAASLKPEFHFVLSSSWSIVVLTSFRVIQIRSICWKRKQKCFLFLFPAGVNTKHRWAAKAITSFLFKNCGGFLAVLRPVYFQWVYFYFTFFLLMKRIENGVKHLLLKYMYDEWQEGPPFFKYQDIFVDFEVYLIYFSSFREASWKVWTVTGRVKYLLLK